MHEQDEQVVTQGSFNLKVKKPKNLLEMATVINTGQDISLLPVKG